MTPKNFSETSVDQQTYPEMSSPAHAPGSKSAQTFSGQNTRSLQPGLKPGFAPTISPTFDPTFEPGHDKNEQGYEHGSMLTRKEAAIALGISRSEFKRREARGMYQATAIDHLGWRLYSIEYLSALPGYGGERRPGRLTLEEKVASFKETHANRPPPKLVPAPPIPVLTRPTKEPKYSYDPKVAAQVFTALDEGLSARQIVAKFLIHPDLMRTIYESWEKFGQLEGGGIVIPPSMLAIINELPLPGSFPVETAAQFLKILQKASEATAMCPMCKKRAAQICVVCAVPEPAPEPLPPAPRPKYASSYKPTGKPVGRPRKDPQSQGE